jgi:transposase-like protein/IS1 family transposase
MIAATCQHETRKKHGRDYKGTQRYRCCLCGQTFLEETARPIGAMRISTKDAVTVLGMLLEGMSIRAVARLTSIDRNTIGDLILTVGGNCQKLLDSKVKNVDATDIQVDELWSFIGLKEKKREARGYSTEFGDSWTFIAVDRVTKLVLAHQVGLRDNDTCWAFMLKLKSAMGSKSFQLTSDGLSHYKLNVPFAFGMQVNFAQLIKTYSNTQETTRYSPAKIASVDKLPIFGEPDHDRISTSHIERMNLSVRMHMRRFTRLTNAHSKSHKHHVAMQAIFFAFYNFCRKHETLKGQTPAMASGLAVAPWKVGELLEIAAQA